MMDHRGLDSNGTTVVPYCHWTTVVHIDWLE